MEWVGEFAPSLPDRGVMTVARQGGRILLTFDTDFGRHVFRLAQPPPPEVVLFRAKRETEVAAALRLLDLLERPEFSLEGRFAVVDSDGFRQRPLAR